MTVVLKEPNPIIRVVGISMKRCAAMHASLKAKHPVLVEELPTLADALGGGIGLDNQYTFAMAQDLIDEFILVSEDEIAQAIRHAYWKERLTIEGSGSVGIAALLSGKLQCSKSLAIIVSGENIDMELHYRIISGENVDVANE